MRNPDTQLALPTSLVGEDEIELVGNVHPRGAVMTLVDTSGSMAPCIAELQSAIDMMLRIIMVEDELACLRADLAIVGCGGDVRTLLEFGAAKPGHVPALPKFVANGETPLGGAVRHAVSMINDRLSEYRRNALATYNPQFVLLSDGRPTDPGWEAAADELCQLAAQRKWLVHVFGVGDAADLVALQRFAGKPVARIQPSQFRELFRWVSRGIQITSRSQNGGGTLPQILPAFPTP